MKNATTGASLLAMSLAMCSAAAAQSSAIGITQQVTSSQPDPVAPPPGPAQAPASSPPPTLPIGPADGASGSPKGSQGDGRGLSDSLQADIEVTASRVANGDPTNHVIVIDRAEIERRGVTSVDDLIRTLPQNLATITPIANGRTRGPLLNRRAPVSALGALGVSAANLGGSGAGNTLVLVNGRRLAGAAGIEDGFVNLNGIPLSAIERVEISQNGASAVYGADAMAGVINFILKKHFTGITLTGQYENSNNGADRLRTSVFAGKNWKTGNISATFEYSDTKPVVNARTGYVTEDYSSVLGGNQRFNFKSLGRGLQPGVIDLTDTLYDPETDTFRTVIRGLTTRPGLTGIPTQDDFIEVGPEAARDYIARYAGVRSRSLSATFNAEQKITDRIRVFANGIATRTTNNQLQELGEGLQVALAPGQAYNPFAAFSLTPFTPGANVAYFPGAEIDDGSLVAGRLKNVAWTWSVNAGVSYDFDKETRLSLIYTTSRATSKGSGTRLGSVAQIVENPEAPGGFSCYDFALAGNQLGARARAARQVAFDRQCAALTSANPNIAFNPWRSGGQAGGGGISDFVYEDVNEDQGSRIQLYEARLNGTLLSLPAGKVQYAAGGEYSTDGVRSDQINLTTGTSQSRSRHAFFGEMNIPVFGRDVTFPLMRSLFINLAGRNDTYETKGAIGTVDNVPFDLGGQLLLGKSTFSRFTPAYGFRWEPVSSVAIQGRWSTGFKAPPPTQLFSPTGTTRQFTTIVNDPLYRCTTDCVTDTGDYYTYAAPSIQAPNPDLRPQTSKQQAFTFTWTPSGALGGLTFGATYNRTRFANEYGSPRDLQFLLSQRQILSLPLFYPRDANGKVIEYRNLTFNLVSSTYASMTYELRYLLDTGIGQFEPSVVVVHNLKAERRGLAASDPVDFIGRIQGPDRYRINGQIAWSSGNWSAALLGYYTPAYKNDYFVDRFAGVISNPQDLLRVKSYATFDLTAAWQATSRARINFVARNIFDPAPPFTVVEQRPYDVARYNAAGRTVSLQANYSF